MAARLVFVLVGSSLAQPPPAPDGADDPDEVMQIFQDRSARGHQPFEPINVNEWDPFAELDPLNVGGATHQFIQPVDLLTGDDDHVTGGASSPPGSLPFHGPNSPASQETFPDEEDPEFLTTDEECEETDGEAPERDEDQCQQHAETGGETTPNFGRTEGWLEFVDVIPGVTAWEKLMHEPWGGEPPEDRATSSSTNDQSNDKEEKSEDTHRRRANGPVTVLAQTVLASLS